jgi:cell division protein FtsA
VPDQFIVGVDVGSSKLCSAVALRDRDGAVRYVGHGSAPSAGVRGGEVVDPEALGSSFKRAVEEARYLIGAQVQDVATCVAGAHLDIADRAGGIDIDPGRAVGPQAIDAVLKEARGADPTGVHTIHRVVRAFALDGEPIDDPTGRRGHRLDVWTRDFTVSSQLVDRLRRAADVAGIRIHTLVAEGVAVATAASSQSERDAGVAVVDIGAATTDIAVYLSGDLFHLTSIPLGGTHLTSDIAAILDIPADEAETLKRAHGVINREAADEELIDWSPRTIAQYQRQAKYGNVPGAAIRSITAARAIEIIDRVKAALDAVEVTQRLRAGVVLTGGSSQLSGIIDIARAILGVPVRAGGALAGDGFPGISDPAAAAGVGLVRYVATRAAMPRQQSSQRSAAATAIVHPAVMKAFARQDTIDVIPDRRRQQGNERDWGRVVRDWMREFIPSRSDQ